eukprot:SAG11_NODE_3275_length_2559_cov_6.359756_3_plen_157_part_00
MGSQGAPFLGKAIDVFGARLCLPLGCLIAAAAFVLLAHAYHPLVLLLGFLAVRRRPPPPRPIARRKPRRERAWVGQAWVGWGGRQVRVCCLGALVPWSTVPISQWFDRKRGPPAPPHRPTADAPPPPPPPPPGASPGGGGGGWGAGRGGGGGGGPL